MKSVAGIYSREQIISNGLPFVSLLGNEIIFFNKILCFLNVFNTFRKYKKDKFYMFNYLNIVVPKLMRQLIIVNVIDMRAKYI